jgi:hypothetical protein
MKKILYFIVAGALPVIALGEAIAQQNQEIGSMPPGASPKGESEPGTFLYYLKWFGGILQNYIVPIVFSLALILFLWGLLSYITAGADEEKRGTARNYMIYGIIALFVMVSVWGLVAILNRTFGIGQGGAPIELPTGPTHVR